VKTAVATTASALILAACSSGLSAAEPDLARQGETWVVEVDVNSRQVTCIVWDGQGAGGIDCDWANAR
jgi:hypothetical protein